MIKLVCFLTRKPGLDRGEFHRHWAESHGPLIAGCEPLSRHIVRYEQHSRLDADYEREEGGGFDGVTIQWFESMKSFGAFVQESAYPELIAPDEDRFLDKGGFGLIFTEEGHAVMEGPRDDAGAKLLCLVKRRPSLDATAFHRHWSEVHGPLIRDTPELARHIQANHQSPRLERDYGRDAGGGFDGLVEHWYADPGEMAAFFAEPAYRERVVPDEKSFIDRTAGRAILSGPARVIIG